MADPFVAEVRIFAGNFAPTGWALCNGQLLPISQNTALFSLLGTTYGGDGKSTFALPDLQDRVPMHPGQGPGLSDRLLGEQGGVETVTLLESEIPAHTHQAFARSPVPANQDDPDATTVLSQVVGANVYAPAGGGRPMAPQALGLAGGDLPHNNLQPYLVLTFIIALQGIFPQRS
jgi:microcystin-dependent protein